MKILPQTQNYSDVRVVIFGRHSQDWMTALAPTAPVWKLLPKVKEVLIKDIGSSPLDLPEISSLRTVIIPLMEEHTINCPTKYPSLIPDRESLRLFTNKADFSKYAISTELSTLCPLTYNCNEEAIFPCVLKRTDLNAGVGVEIVTSIEHLQQLLKEPLWHDRPYILQAYIPNQPDYVTHCICKNGRILWHCSYAYDCPENTIRRPELCLATKKVGLLSLQLKEMEHFLRPLLYSGPCNIDFRIRANGHLAVFEINPRLGGSLMLPENITDLQSALECIIAAALDQNC